MRLRLGQPASAWVVWLLATSLSTFAGNSAGGFLIADPLRPRVISAGEPVSGAGVLAGIVLTGVLVGLAQWLVLRRSVAGAGWWIVATAAGMAVGLAIGRTLLPGAALAIDAPAAAQLAAARTAAALTLGLSQWLVLRRWVAPAAWWPAAVLAGDLPATAVLVAQFGEAVTAVALGEVVPAPGPLAPLASWVVPGAITGLALTLLLARRARTLE